VGNPAKIFLIQRFRPERVKPAEGGNPTPIVIFYRFNKVGRSSLIDISVSTQNLHRAQASLGYARWLLCHHEPYVHMKIIIF
jgi:hypothetical protein